MAKACTLVFILVVAESARALRAAALFDDGVLVGDTARYGKGRKLEEECPDNANLVNGRCVCDDGFFAIFVPREMQCTPVVPVGLGCEGQSEPSCREMGRFNTAKCCPEPPRGDQWQCVAGSGSGAGLCIGETAAPAPQAMTPEPTPNPVTPHPVTPEPSPSPVTPEPSPQPITPDPTPNPVTPEPSPQPITPAPSPNPVTPKPFGGSSEKSACMTQDECAAMSSKMGLSEPLVGSYPTKGCFSKNSIAYWSGGGSPEEMSKPDLPGVQERIWCEEESSGTPVNNTPAGTECETGLDADPSKSCVGNNLFCQLGEGVCNTKIGVHSGKCEVLPETCIAIYLPICGCDGNTYSNECTAHSKGISISRKGKCGNAPAPSPLEPSPDPGTPGPSPQPVTPEHTPNPVTPEPSPRPITPVPSPNPVTPESLTQSITPVPSPNPFSSKSSKQPKQPLPSSDPITPESLTQAVTPVPSPNPVTPESLTVPITTPVRTLDPATPESSTITPGPSPNPATSGSLTQPITPSPSSNPVTPEPFKQPITQAPSPNPVTSEPLTQPDTTNSANPDTLPEPTGNTGADSGEFVLSEVNTPSETNDEPSDNSSLAVSMFSLPGAAFVASIGVGALMMLN